MAIFEWLNHIDTEIFLFFNGKNNLFSDHFFSLFTGKEVWFPFYLLLLVILILKYKREGIWVALFLILAIVFSDQVSGLIKELVQRVRPSHEPALAGIVNIPGPKGGLYGFVSSHAANAFTLALYISFVSKSRWLSFGLIVWAMATAYSRIHVGVHYPFDVLAGALLGCMSGWGFWRLFHLFDGRFLQKKIFTAGKWEKQQTLYLITALLLITVTLLIISRIAGTITIA